MTAAQARRDRKKLLRELKQSERSRHRSKVKALRDEEKRARLDARDQLRQARELCRVNRETARDIANEAYRKARELALEARRAKKRAAAEGCAAAKDYIRRCGEIRQNKARAERHEAIRFRAELARIEEANRSRDKANRLVARKARRSESDDAVRSNIPDRLVPLWERVKRTIKSSDRMSRTESFLHYAEENPGEVTDALERAAEKELARVLRAHHAEQKAERRRRREAEVPF